MISIFFPRNYPYSESNQYSYGKEVVRFLDGQQVVLFPGESVNDNPKITDCFFDFQVPFNNTKDNKTIEFGLAWLSELTPSAHGDILPDSCSSHTIVPDVPVRHDGAITPLRQLQAGVTPQDIACPEGYKLIFTPVSGKPLCATPSTANMLIDRWTKGTTSPT